MESWISSCGKRRLPQKNNYEPHFAVTYSEEIVTAGTVWPSFSRLFPHLEEDLADEFWLLHPCPALGQLPNGLVHLRWRGGESE
jgi:hypothetical protein